MEKLIGQELPQSEGRRTKIMQPSYLRQIKAPTEEYRRGQVDNEVDDDEVASHWRSPASPSGGRR